MGGSSIPILGFQNLADFADEYVEEEKKEEEQTVTPHKQHHKKQQQHISLAELKAICRDRCLK